MSATVTEIKSETEKGHEILSDGFKKLSDRERYVGNKVKGIQVYVKIK